MGCSTGEVRTHSGRPEPSSRGSSSIWPEVQALCGNILETDPVGCTGEVWEVLLRFLQSYARLLEDASFEAQMTTRIRLLGPCLFGDTAARSGSPRRLRRRTSDAPGPSGPGDRLVALKAGTALADRQRATGGLPTRGAVWWASPGHRASWGAEAYGGGRIRSCAVMRSLRVWASMPGLWAGRSVYVPPRCGTLRH
jgi:hypothetical protein